MGLEGKWPPAWAQELTITFGDGHRRRGWLMFTGPYEDRTALGLNSLLNCGGSSRD